MPPRSGARKYERLIAMGLSIFLAYAFFMFAASFSLRRKQKNEESFFLNSRSSSACLVAFSIIVSCVGASATMGTVGLAFEAGTPAFWWLGSGAVGLSALTIFLAGRVRRSRAHTMPEIVESFFGPFVRKLVSVLIVAAWLAILAAQFTAMGRVVSAMTGFEISLALAVGAVLITIHTAIGGQAAIIKLDRWQFSALTAGLALTLWWLWQINGSVLPAIKVEAVNESFPFSRLVYFLAVIGGSYVVCPTLFGRLLSAESEAAAKKGAFGAVLGLAFISIMVVMVGLMARGLISADVPGDAVLTTILETVFPKWLTMVIYVVLLSAIVSSADSCLVTAGLVLAYDVFGKRSLTASRCSIAALALGGFLLTFMAKGILGFLLMANDIYVCGVVGPVFVGLMLPENSRVDYRFAACGIIAGGALGLFSSFSGNLYYSYLGIASSTFLTILGTRANLFKAAETVSFDLKKG